MLLLAERAQKVKFDSATASATVSWRDNLLIHPAVELFPPMSSGALDQTSEQSCSTAGVGSTQLRWLRVERSRWMVQALWRANSSPPTR